MGPFASYSTLRMQYMHCIVAAKAVAPSTPAGPSAAKRVAVGLDDEDGISGVASLLRDRRLLRTKGPGITSFIAGSVVGFLPRPLPGKVLQGLPADVHEQLYDLFCTAILGVEERAAVARLLFDSSRDGCASDAFHAACDGKGPTLVICLAPEGQVFGGYVQTSWYSGNGFGDGYMSDSNAFLFSAISPNDGGVPQLIPSSIIKAMTGRMLFKQSVLEVLSL